MREMVITTIADQPDIEIVGDVEPASNLADLVDEMQPDVLIVALDEQQKRSEECGFLLGRYPRMRILALAPERNCGIFYWSIVRHSQPPGGEFASRDPERAARRPVGGGGRAELRERYWFLGFSRWYESREIRKAGCGSFSI